MNGVEVFFATLGFVWLGYAGYRLWGGTASPTARWVGVGLVGFLGFGLAMDLLDFGGSGRYSATQGNTQSEAVKVGGSKMCIGCTALTQDGLYLLQSTWMVGELKLEPAGPQPYALSFERGSVELDAKALSPGCSSGELVDDTKLQINGARKLRLEVGPGASCTR
jgi:hypothetical protein